MAQEKNNKPAALPDTQNSQDTRHIPIDKVGIKDIRHPVTISDKSGSEQNTVASFNMYVNLPHDFKGTHMSRFVEILNRNEYAVTVKSFRNMLEETIKLLDAEEGHIEMTFPYFINKKAPVSGVQSLMDYDVTFLGEIKSNLADIRVKIVIPCTSLCPCSRNISEYGAHNQRSHITVIVKMKDFMWIEDIINLVENEASCQLWALLKRPDEKYVTEHAYDNPKFVEDIVRDIAVAFNNEERISGYSVSSENFESIHNHSAYAELAFDKEAK